MAGGSGLVNVGLVKFGDKQATGEDELMVGRVARSLTEIHGGRFLSIFWTQGYADMVITFEGREYDQAEKVFGGIEEQTGVRIEVLPALAEGEKERAVQGTLETDASNQTTGVLLSPSES